MKTLTEVKRAIQVGTRLRCVSNSKRPELNGLMRTVTKAQTNGFFWTQDGEEAKGRFWTPYPKAADAIVEDNTFALTIGPGCTVVMRIEVAS